MQLIFGTTSKRAFIKTSTFQVPIVDEVPELEELGPLVSLVLLLWPLPGSPTDLSLESIQSEFGSFRFWRLNY